MYLLPILAAALPLLLATPSAALEWTPRISIHDCDTISNGAVLETLAKARGWIDHAWEDRESSDTIYNEVFGSSRKRWDGYIQTRLLHMVNTADDSWFGGDDNTRPLEWSIRCNKDTCQDGILSDGFKDRRVTLCQNFFELPFVASETCPARFESKVQVIIDAISSLAKNDEDKGENGPRLRTLDDLKKPHEDAGLAAGEYEATRSNSRYMIFVSLKHNDTCLDAPPPAPSSSSASRSSSLSYLNPDIPRITFSTQRTTTAQKTTSSQETSTLQKTSTSQKPTTSPPPTTSQPTLSMNSSTLQSTPSASIATTTNSLTSTPQTPSSTSSITTTPTSSELPPLTFFSDYPLVTTYPWCSGIPLDEFGSCHVAPDEHDEL